MILNSEDEKRMYHHWSRIYDQYFSYFLVMYWRPLSFSFSSGGYQNLWRSIIKEIFSKTIIQWFSNLYEKCFNENSEVRLQMVINIYHNIDLEIRIFSILEQKLSKYCVENQFIDVICIFYSYLLLWLWSNHHFNDQIVVKIRIWKILLLIKNIFFIIWKESQSKQVKY